MLIIVIYIFVYVCCGIDWLCLMFSVGMIVVKSIVYYVFNLGKSWEIKYVIGVSKMSL